MTRSEAIKILSERDANGCLVGFTGGNAELLDFVVEELHRMNYLETSNEALNDLIRMLKEDKAIMQGMIDGLKFAIRCNGVSGSEV